MLVRLSRGGRRPARRGSGDAADFSDLDGRCPEILGLAFHTGDEFEDVARGIAGEAVPNLLIEFDPA